MIAAKVGLRSNEVFKQNIIKWSAIKPEQLVRNLATVPLFVINGYVRYSFLCYYQ